MDTGKIGGMGYAPRVVVAPDARKVGIEEALNSIREYAIKNRWMTGTILSDVFKAGLEGLKLPQKDGP